MRGQPKLIKRNDSENWFIYIPKRGERRAQRLNTGTSDYSEADLIFTQWKLERKKPSLSPLDEVKVTDMLNRYAEYKAEDVTVRYHMRHLLPYFQAYPVSAVTNATGREYAKHRCSKLAKRGKSFSTRTVSPATARRELDTLISSLNFGKTEGYIYGDIPDIERPDAAPPRAKWLTEKELDALLGATERPYLKTYLMIARHTAARPSSILELKWFQVNLEDRLIHFNPDDRAQTKKHRPSVYMNSALFAHLKEAFKEKKSEHVVATSKQGKRVESIKRAFSAACDRAGIKGATPYTLRHTAITTMIRKGFGLAQAGQVAGHRDPRTTMRYAKYDPSFTKSVVECLADSTPVGVTLAHIAPEKAEIHHIAPEKKDKKQ